jgi:membrane glycosyltransferase
MDEIDANALGRSGRPRRGPTAEYALLPAETPLAMPTQPLRLPLEAAQRTRDQLTLPRAVLLGLAVVATAAFAYVLYKVLSVLQLTPLQGVFLVLCTLCFAWIALGTSSAVLGFFSTLQSHRPQRQAASAPRSASRTALLFPIYQEDTARIAAAIEAIANDLIANGAGARFDIFVLSDSRQAAIRSRELRAVRLLRRIVRDRMQVFYRARTENVGKKAGNIADWVRRFGAAYDTFIILDADSIMSGPLLIRLADMMDGEPKLGLVQTVPRLIGARTLFARLQQFAVAYYGPIISAGFATWYQGSGNYWGHNAIVRTRAFASCAGLPELAGKPPLGGHVQSHDFVEAAFLRRAGWEVRMLPFLKGSYEGCPPTLIDVAVRDRRWAQGNFQHVRIVGARGLPWVSRMHLAMGTYAYLSSALWALSLLVGVVLAFQSVYTLPIYFPDEKTLFPVWPVIDPTAAYYLFLGTIATVLLPKVLAVVLALVDPAAQGGGGGRLRMLAGATIEMLFSILMAPVLMMTQTGAVLEILRGKDSGWSAQRRDGGAPAIADALRFHAWHVLVGAAATITCALISIYVLAWMLPIILGLLLSAILSHASALDPPKWVAWLLATPEDVAPPSIVAAASATEPAWQTRLARGMP